MVDRLFTGEGPLASAGVNERLIPWVPTAEQMSVLYPNGLEGRPCISFGAIAERALDWTCEHLAVTIPQEVFERIVADIEEDFRRRVRVDSIVRSSKSDSLFPSFFRSMGELAGVDPAETERLLQSARIAPEPVMRALWYAYGDVVRRVDLHVTATDCIEGSPRNAPCRIEPDIRHRFREECARSETMLSV